MGRPLSSDILYPFIPRTPRNDITKGIKDIVLTTYDTPSATLVSVPSMNDKAFASLIRVSPTPLTMTFRSYLPQGDDMFQTRDTVFEIFNTTGFGSVRSLDGFSTLFLSFSEITPPTSTVDMNNDEYVLEPCVVRWLQESVNELIMVNERRVSDPLDRLNLPNTIMARFSEAEPIKLNNGYNMELSEDGSDVKFIGALGAGKGIAPDNMWDDGFLANSATPLKSINGQGPDLDGNFYIETTSHISLKVDNEKLWIKDLSQET